VRLFAGHELMAALAALIEIAIRAGDERARLRRCDAPATDDPKDRTECGKFFFPPEKPGARARYCAEGPCAARGERRAQRVYRADERARDREEMCTG